MKMRKMRGSLSLLILGFLLVSLVFAVALKQYSLSAAASAESSAENSEESTDGSHFISIYDKGERLNIRSDAETVRDALQRAEINLDDGDKVEPALDENITSNDFNINIYRAQNLLVIDGNHKTYVKTANTSPEDIVVDAGAKLLEGDVVKHVPYDSILESGNTHAYKIVRAKIVKINYYGEQLEKRTQAKTVGAFLNEQNIDTDNTKNWISVPLDTAITDGISFAIQPQGKQTITVNEEVAFKETVTQDFDMEYGKRQVTKAGEKGSKKVTYEVDMKDGVELSRKKLSEIITKQPVTQEVKVGMKMNLPSGSHEDWMSAAGISQSDFGYVNFIISHESGWRPNASNGKYFGLYQTSKARLVGDCGNNWVNDPVCQLRSATKYATSRYGSWAGAYAKWKAQRWW